LSGAKTTDFLSLVFTPSRSHPTLSALASYSLGFYGRFLRSENFSMQNGANLCIAAQMLSDRIT